MTRKFIIIFVVVAGAFIPAFSYAASIARPSNNIGLIGHWTFDGGDMVPNVRDRSGNGNHGNLSGQIATSTVLGKISQALNFDGVDDRVTVSTTANSVRAISFWMKPTTEVTYPMTLSTTHEVKTKYGYFSGEASTRYINGVLATETVGSELVYVGNTSFTTDLGGWQDFNGSFTTRDTSTYNSAPASAKITYNSSGNGDFVNRGFSVTSGNLYRVSFWAKASSARTLQYATSEWGGSFPTIGFTHDYKVTTDWKQYNFYVYATLSSSDAYITFVGDAGGSAYDLWVDDVSIKQVTGDSATVNNGEWYHYTIVPNSSFDANNIILGRFNNTFNSGYLSGALDDVRMYNRSLSAFEAAAAYNAGVATFSSSYTASGLRSGLVGHWTFDGKDMTPNVRDASGQGNHANLSGQVATATTMGMLGQALRFDGVNDKAVAPDLNINTNATYTLWVKPNNNFGTSGAGVFDTKPGGVGAVRIFGHTGTPTQLCWDIGGNTPNQCTSNAGYDISDWTGEWHFLSVVLSGGNTTTLFVDGVDVGTVSNSVSAASNTFEIGFFNSNFFDGTIDDVRAYNRALSATEIKQLYATGGSKLNSSQNDGRGSLNNSLTALWSFDGKDMTPRVMDRSGNSYNGTIIGQTSTTTTIGKLGQAISFDGVNDYINISPGISYSDSFSVSFWANVRSNAGSYRAFVIGRGAGQEDYNTGFVIDMGPSSSSVWDYIGVEGIGMNTNTDLLNTSFDFNTWHHIVVDFTVGSNTVKLYADGVLRDTRSRSAGSVGLGEVQIGARNYSSSVSGYFDGSIDDVRIYSKSLSASEVKQLYNMGR